MDDIIRTVTERVGIPQDKARSAVDIIVGQLKSRLPAPLASQIDGALSGKGAAGGLGGAPGGAQSGSAERRDNLRN